MRPPHRRLHRRDALLQRRVEVGCRCAHRPGRGGGRGRGQGPRDRALGRLLRLDRRPGRSSVGDRVESEVARMRPPHRRLHRRDALLQRRVEVGCRCAHRPGRGGGRGRGQGPRDRALGRLLRLDRRPGRSSVGDRVESEVARMRPPHRRLAAPARSGPRAGGPPEVPSARCGHSTTPTRRSLRWGSRPRGADTLRAGADGDALTARAGAPESRAGADRRHLRPVER